MKKLFLCAFLAIACPIYSIQVIQVNPTPCSGAVFGQAMGIGIGNMMHNLEIQKTREMAAKEALRQQQYNNYMQQMIQLYTPERHNEFVNCIVRSRLDPIQKEIMFSTFDTMKRLSNSENNRRG